MSNVENSFIQAGTDPQANSDSDNVLRLNGTVVMSGRILQSDNTQAAAITDPTGGATVDAEARAAINAILAFLRNTGQIQT